MRRILSVSLLMILLVSLPAGAAKLPEELISGSVLVLKEMASEPDSEHMRNVLKKAHGVAIFPSVIKAGIGLGGRFGEGLILKYDPVHKTWYGPYFVQLKGLSYGFQVGFQSTSLVLVITTERGMESLQNGKITLGGSLSVAVGPMGRSAEAGTDLKLEAAIYSYSLSKGAFIGASFEGAVIDNNVNANQVFWNQKLQPSEALSRRASSKEVKELINQLNLMMN